MHEMLILFRSSLLILLFSRHRLLYECISAKKKARRKINWDSIDLEERTGVSACFVDQAAVQSRVSTDPMTVSSSPLILSCSPTLCIRRWSIFCPLVQAEDDMGNASSEPEDLGDYEDEVDDDYAENYFDNGEDDDVGDDDGGEPAYD